MPSTKPCSPAAAADADAAAAAATSPAPTSAPSPSPGLPKELGEAAVRLEVAAHHHRVVGLERLGHAIDERPREAERVADLAHGRACPVGHHVADHARVRLAVA